MLFTWNTENLCIVFRSWHVRSNTGLVVSLLAVIGLVAGYEALRAGIARYEEAARRRDSEGIASTFILSRPLGEHFLPLHTQLPPIYPLLHPSPTHNPDLS